MSYMFREASTFNQDLSSWKDKVSENMSHAYFSGGNCPLRKSCHPYESWADKDDPQ